MDSKTIGIGCLGALLLFMIFSAFTIIGTYNGLVKKEQAVTAQWAQVENVYQRRADLIPNLVSTVQGAASFEQSTLTAVTDARARVGQVTLPSNGPQSQEQLNDFAGKQAQLGSALSRLLVVSENYPQLRATEGFRDLQAQLEGTENRITVERGRFNDAAQAYNTGLRTFPTVLYAALLGFKEKPYFQATAGSETPPPVHFNFNNQPAPAPAH